MSKNNKPASKALEESGEAIDPASLKPDEIGIFVATTNISTGDNVYKAGDELNPEDFDDFERLLEIGFIKVISPEEKQ